MNASNPSPTLQLAITKLENLDEEIEFSCNNWQETLLEILRLIQAHK